MEVKKPSTKRKTSPKIKQTKASAYRILRANPLLMHNTDSVKRLGIKNRNEIPETVDVLGILGNTQRLNNNREIKKNQETKRNPQQFKFNKNTNAAGCATNVTSQRNPRRLSITAMYRNKMQKSGKRRSRSAEKLDPNICVKKSVYEEAASRPEVSQSLEDLREDSLLDIDSFNLSPIGKKKLKVAFKTPPTGSRRSSFHQKFSNSTPAPSTFTASRGLYMELDCNNMGVLKTKENKENSNRIKFDENFIGEVAARNALYSLKQSIQDGLPSNDCEALLGSIRQIHRHLESIPVYWECRAALEQCKGNISSAVEHFRKAIVQGAKVQTVAESLDRLLQMFNLFHVNSDVGTKNNDGARIMLDARNAFKSTIIELAVQERNIKREAEYEKNETAKFFTPHTRISMRHRGTSTVTISATLSEIDGNTEFPRNTHY